MIEVLVNNYTTSFYVAKNKKIGHNLEMLFTCYKRQEWQHKIEYNNTRSKEIINMFVDNFFKNQCRWKKPRK